MAAAIYSWPTTHLCAGSNRCLSWLELLFKYTVALLYIKLISQFAHFKLKELGLIYSIIFKSSPTLWWCRLIVFAESARRLRRRILFLLSLENPCSDYFQIFAVCILALGNLPGKFFFCVFSVSSTKSKMAAKILCRSLELGPLHRFASCLV